VSPGALLLGRLLALPADTTREQAHDAARAELSRQEYADARPGLVARLVGRALTALGDLFDRASATVGGNPLLRALIAVALLALVAVALSRAQRRTGPARRPGALFDGARSLSAKEHRDLAEAAAAQGRWPDAVRERLRAVVRELEVRGVLDPQPGRTAGEVARDAGAAAPDLAADLDRGARTFAEVWYGGRPGERGAYDVLVALDSRVRLARTPAPA
jgi:hypothetical protein